MDTSSGGHASNVTPAALSMPIAAQVTSRHELGRQQQHSKELWEAQKPVIWRLYNLENKPYNRVIDILRTDYNFIPTRRQFYRKIHEWAFDKNIKDNEMRSIVQSLDQTSSGDPEITVKLRGNKVDPAKIQRWQKRHGKKDAVRSVPSRRSAGPSSGRFLMTIDERMCPTINPPYPALGCEELSSISHTDVSKYSNDTDGYEKEDLSFWKSIDIPGSPRLSHLFEALTIECKDCVPSLSYNSFTSDSSQLGLEEIDNDEITDADQLIEVSTETNFNDIVSYSRNVFPRKDIFSSGAEGSLPELSYSEWSISEWDFARGRPVKTRLDLMYGIPLFPVSPETSRGGSSILEISFPPSQLWDAQTAESGSRSRLRRLKKGLGEEHPQTLRAKKSLGDIYAEQFKLRQAERLYRQAASTYQRNQGLENVDTLSSYLDVVDIMNTQCAWRRALKIHGPVHEIILKLFKPDDRITLRSNSIRADILYYLGQVDEAEKLARLTLQTDLYTFGPRDYSTLYDMRTFAVILRLTGRLGEAEQLLRIVLQLHHKVRGVAEQLFHSSVHALLDLLIDEGRHEECKILATTLAERLEASFGSEHPYTLYSLFKSAICSRMQGDLQESESQLRRILELQRREFGENDPTTLHMSRELSYILGATGRYVEAMGLLQKSCSGATEIFGIDHPTTLLFCGGLADMYERLGRHDDALSLYKRTMNQARKLEVTPNSSLLKSMLGLASLLRKSSRYEEAIPFYEDCLSGFLDIYGLSDPLTIYTCDRLGVCYERLGRHDDALAFYQRTLYQLQSAEGEEHLALVKISASIKAIQEHCAFRREDAGVEQHGLEDGEVPSVEAAPIDEEKMNRHGGLENDDTALAEERWMNEVFDFEMSGNGHFITID